ALTDGLRTADEDNPHGYFELEAVKRTKQDASWLEGAHGRGVKLIHVLLDDLPPASGGWADRGIMMKRDLDGVIASQGAMLARSGKKGAGAPAEALKRAFLAQLSQVDRMLAGRADVRRLDVAHGDVIADPAGQAARVAEFVGAPAGAVSAMAGA